MDLGIVSYGLFLCNQKLLYMEDVEAELQVSFELAPPSSSFGKYAWGNKSSIKYCCENPACQPINASTASEKWFLMKNQFRSAEWQDLSKRCRCPGIETVSFGCTRRGAESISMHTPSGIDISTHEIRFMSTWDSQHDDQAGWYVDVTESSATSNIESFTLQIEHYVSTSRQSRLPVSLPDQAMEGYLWIPDDTQSQRDICKFRPDARRGLHMNKRTNKAPCYINATDTSTKDSNVFTIQFLLDIWGIDLDDTVRPHLGTIRSEGLTVYLHINHLNALPWRGRLGKIIYVYSFHVFMNPLHNQDRDHKLDMGSNLRSHKRLTFHPSYIHLVASERQGLKIFSIHSALLVFARLFVLFKIVRLIVRFIAEHCMPLLSDSYHDLLTTTAPEYHDVQQLASLDDFAIKRSLSSLQLNVRFDRRRAKKQLLQDGWESGMHLRGGIQRELEMAVMV